MQFSRNLLFSGSYLSLEHRVQNLLTYLDAAARGDGELMLRIEQGLTQQEERARAGRNETPVPVQGRSHLGQHLSIDCNEEKPFESLDEYAQAAARSVPSVLFSRPRPIRFFNNAPCSPLASRAD